MPQGRIGITDCVYNGKKNHAKFRVKKKKTQKWGSDDVCPDENSFFVPTNRLTSSQVPAYKKRQFHGTFHGLKIQTGKLKLPICVTRYFQCLLNKDKISELRNLDGVNFL